MRFTAVLFGCLLIALSAFAGIETNQSIQNIAIECKFNDKESFQLDTLKGDLLQTNSSRARTTAPVQYIRIAERLPKEFANAVEYLQLHDLLEKPLGHEPVEYVRSSYNEKFSFAGNADENRAPLQRCDFEWSGQEPIALTCELYNLKWHYQGNLANVAKLKIVMAIAGASSNSAQHTTGRILYPQGVSTEFDLPFSVSLPLKFDGKTTLVETDDSCSFKVAYKK